MKKSSVLETNISKLLSRRGSLSEAETTRLQVLLHRAGFNNNYSKFGADGNLGLQSLRDIAAYVREHPGLREMLSPQLRQGLLRHQLFGEFTNSATRHTATVGHAVKPNVAMAETQPATLPSPRALKPLFTTKAGIVSAIDVNAAWAAVEGRAHGRHSSASYNTDKPLIVLDPGHGAGRDKGAHSRSGLFETDVVDPLALATARHLRRNGYDVAFTRDPGTDLRYDRGDHVGPHRLDTVAARAQFALELARITGHREVRLLSIHADAAGNPDAHGSTVYAGAMGIRNGKKDFGLPAISAASTAFAASVGKAFHIDGDVPAKQSTADVGVLRRFDRYSTRSGITGASGLLEVGYLTNAHDAARMQGMINNPDQAGARIASGIMSFSHPHTRAADASAPYRAVA